jgi:hypothetical protein
LVFIDDEEGGAFAADEAALLRFERGDDDGGIEVLGEVASGDADVPTAGAPFGEFVIGECAGGDGVDGLAAVFPWLDQASKMSVLPAPVGAWTMTSLPSRRAPMACCCQTSGMMTWFSDWRFSNWPVSAPMPAR